MDAVLITGGAGFIGSHLAERLLTGGRSVGVLDNFDRFYDPAHKEHNVAGALSFPDYRLVRGDLRDDAALDAAFEAVRPRVVVHLAAKAGVRPSIEDPLGYASVNVDGTARLLEASRRHGVKRFVFGSSSSVYGNNPKVPFAEDDPVDHPISPYAATKRSGELICHTYHHLHGFDVACLRFFTVFGPRQRPDLAIRKFADRLAEGRDIEVYGDGSTARDYTYVADIVDGIVRALEQVRGFQIWNLGGSHPVTLEEMVAKVGAALGIEPRVRRLPAQPGDVERTWADVRRAKDDLGWEAQVSFDDGLALFAEWFHTERSRVLRDGGSR